jgi:chemotaxis protein MotB
MSRRKHAQHEEEHENHERWLITYADMITLLMVLFIVLFAMSTVEEKKFNALKEGLAAGFGQSTSVLDGSSSILEEPGTSPTETINPSRSADSPEIAELKVQAVNDAMREQNVRRYAEAAAEADRLAEIEKKILAVLRSEHLEDDVQTVIDGRGLTVSLVSRHVVFEANLATLSPRGQQIVDTLAPVLLAIDDDLAIEGHTNQAPGAPKFFASDWDLSAARAVTVLRRLNELRGIPAERLSAVGFGKVRPLVDPTRPGSQQLNKRVDIVVQSGLAEENRELLDQVVYDRARPASAELPGGHSDDSDQSNEASDNKDDKDVVRSGKEPS